MTKMITLLLILLTKTSLASSVWNVFIPKAQYESTKELKYSHRYILFSNGQIQKDYFEEKLPAAEVSPEEFPNYCQLSLRLRSSLWNSLPKETELPGVQFQSKIRPDVSEGSHLPGASFDDGKTYSGFINFRFGEKVLIKQMPNGDALDYFFVDISCRKTIPSSKYNEELSAGKITDDAMIKEAMGSFVRPQAPE